MSARLVSALLIGLAACAGPRIPASPLIPPPAAAHQGPVLQPCVLLHQAFEADRSAALDDGGDGKAKMEFATILLRHPVQGVVLIDPGVGKEKAHDFGELPWLMRRQVGDGSQAVALGDLLTGIGVAPESVKTALITHFHYDHLGGATDIPAAQLFSREPDLEWSGHARTLLFYQTMPHDQVDRIRSQVKVFKTDGPPYEGFAGSFDVFGDGSIVGVPTPGHTPGSTSWFVNSGDGRRWLFVGDAAWLMEGIRKPSHKGWQGRRVDDDADANSETLARLHALQLARPVTTPPDGRGVQVITAHDPEGLRLLPMCAKP